MTRSPRRRSLDPARPAHSVAAEGDPAGRWQGLVLDLATLILALWTIASLLARTHGAQFQTDECFHATMAEWIASHHTLPRTIPEFYSGFYYYYPPLFHLLGAGWIGVLGLAALPTLNVFVTALILAVAWIGGRALGGPDAGRWAVALCAANTWLALHAVRFYVEQLTTLLTLGAMLLILVVRRGARARTIVALGVVTGLALTAKHSSLVLIELLIGLAVFYRLRGARAPARAYFWAAGLALLVAAPMLIRNQVLFGSPIYPALARDVDPLLLRLNQAKFTPDPRAFYLHTAIYTGAPIGLMMAGAFALALLRRRGSLELGLLAFCLGLYAVAPLQPLLEPRHMLPAMVAVAVIGSIAVARGLEDRRRGGAGVRRGAEPGARASAGAPGEAALSARAGVRRGAEPGARASAGAPGEAALSAARPLARLLGALRLGRSAVGVALIVMAAVGVARMPHFRRLLDLPADTAAAYQAVRENVPEGETVLSVSTYDTYYYTRRPATWPIAWGQKEHPVEMFLTTDCDSVMLALRRHHLHYLLVSRVAQGNEFDGANHPLGFLTCIGALIDRGRLELLWSSPQLGLLRVRE